MDQSTPAGAQATAGGLSSLLSLSIAAEHAGPIPVPPPPPTLPEPEASVGSYNAYGHGSLHTSMKHRRLSSAGQTRRRLSDARDAAARPSSQAAAALQSLAALSLSSTPPPGPAQGVFKLEKAASTGTPTSASTPIPIPANKEDGRQEQSLSTGSGSGKTGKKRGTIFQCESCSKVYRHPSCLIKHRWEHSPHWREASKFVLSKHQQVQLLEAAAILSHMKPGTSLPDDRSLWPSFLSGGLLPPPATTNLAVNGTTSRAKSVSAASSYNAAVTSSSAPNGRGSAGPRMHAYEVAGGGITQIRPGLVGVPTATSASVPAPSAPVPVPGSYSSVSASVQSESWASSAAGWSLPSSSLRSRSGSRSDEEYVDVGEAEGVPGGGFSARRWGSVKEEEGEEGWDGMEMEMDMD